MDSSLATRNGRLSERSGSGRGNAVADPRDERFIWLPNRSNVGLQALVGGETHVARLHLTNEQASAPQPLNGTLYVYRMHSRSLMAPGDTVRWTGKTTKDIGEALGSPSTCRWSSGASDCG
jgi:hypothetical protein